MVKYSLRLVTIAETEKTGESRVNAYADFLEAVDDDVLEALDSEGQKVKLDLYEGMSHVFQAFMPDTPESKMAMGKVDAFLKQHLGK